MAADGKCGVLVCGPHAVQRVAAPHRAASQGRVLIGRAPLGTGAYCNVAALSDCEHDAVGVGDAVDDIASGQCLLSDPSAVGVCCSGALPDLAVVATCPELAGGGSGCDAPDRGLRRQCQAHAVFGPLAGAVVASPGAGIGAGGPDAAAAKSVDAVQSLGGTGTLGGPAAGGLARQDGAALSDCPGLGAAAGPHVVELLATAGVGLSRPF